MTGLKRYFTYLIAAVLIFSISITPAAAATVNTSDTLDSLALEAEKYNFQIVENTDGKITAKAEYDETELYATLDKTSNEYSMEVVEKPNNILGIGKDIVTEFEVEVEEISSNYSNVKAVIKDKKMVRNLKLKKIKKRKPKFL